MSFTFKDHTNKDEYRTRDGWLNLTKDWDDPYGVPEVVRHNDISVVRDDFIIGTKARAADFLFSKVKEDTVVYVQPRAGAAGVSIIEAAKRHGKKVVLFMPSSRKMSETQAITIERGAIPKFRRAAAMPNLNREAKAWAEENNAFFIPLGLKHEYITAALVRIAMDLRDTGFNPESMAVATSTGTLIRALQIAFPCTKFYSLAVARNLQEGEKGAAEFHTDERPFLRNTRFPCPFATYDNYDRKCWEFVVNHGGIESMWNVGCQQELLDTTLYNRIDSYRKWPKNMNDEELKYYYNN